MASFTPRTLLSVIVHAALGLAYAAADEPTVTAAATCTTGAPMTTAGYPMSYYTPAIPTAKFENGYQPEPAWSSSHVVGTQTFGVPPPVETGFAYAQFKCQYYCNNADSRSFFVNYAGKGSPVGSYCSCFNEMLDPGSFVDNNQTLVGAWNHLCK
ncbi:hypothetical protein F5Y06DRAFT_150748 [Hypoxylon sp. FL0890]|nr:hypothetical protein F5Y06DRAFT_150748 [Hypoxylon sp. FL0890]